MWSEEGCSLTQETSTHVTCACNHLSSFAVIHVCCSLHPSLSACVALLQRCISTRDCMMLRLLLLMYCMLKPPLSAMQLALCYTASKHCALKFLSNTLISPSHLPPFFMHACQVPTDTTEAPSQPASTLNVSEIVIPIVLVVLVVAVLTVVIVGVFIYLR